MTPPAADNESGRPVMSRHDLAELAMLADGSLSPDRRAEAEARIIAQPGGSARLENERRAVEALRAAATVRAPASLRDRIAADRARAGRSPGRRRVAPAGGLVALRRRLVAPGARRMALGGGLAGALAVVALALVLILPGGSPGAPSVSQAAALALRGPSSTGPLPIQDAAANKLASNVEDVYFPARLGPGANATGERVDQIGGRVARTVYYTTQTGAQIAYTIVAGSALAWPRGAARSEQNRISLRSIVLGGRIVVTWRRHGRTCILSAAGVPDARLRDLAAWRASV